MLVFIDESGDAGFKLDRGSSAVFAVAMVMFCDVGAAQQAAAAIEELRTRWPTVTEFKFSKASNDLRDQFFETVKHLDFRVRCLVVEKEKIYSPRLRSDKEQFYRFFVKSMLKFDNGRLADAKVVIDGSGERTFRLDLQTHLRRHTPEGAIKSVRMKDSKNDPLIQLADMCVGAVARSFREDRADSSRWRAMLRSKLDDIWRFQ